MNRVSRFFPNHSVDHVLMCYLLICGTVSVLGTKYVMDPFPRSPSYSFKTVGLHGTT